MNLVIFDFCDTLVNFQTADAFVHFTLKKSKNRKAKVIHFLDKMFEKLKIYSVLYRLKINKSLQKNILLFGLKGMTKEELIISSEAFEEKVIQKRLNGEIYSLLVEHVKSKDNVIINSGGYNIYLEIFAKKTGVLKLYATDFEFNNDIFTGKISGKDCLHEEKITRMVQDGIDFSQYEEIFVYSDSVTDMPIFDIATKKFAVIKNKEIPSWCKGNSFNILNV